MNVKQRCLDALRALRGKRRKKYVIKPVVQRPGMVAHRVYYRYRNARGARNAARLRMAFGWRDYLIQRTLEGRWELTLYMPIVEYERLRRELTVYAR
jgi:hypothetical protein